MKELNIYNIPFVGLKTGEHRFDYEITGKFFELYDFLEFNEAKFDVRVDLSKNSTFMELNLSFTGAANVVCDVTSENFDLPLEGKLRLVVKFGDEFNDDNPEILTLPQDEYQVNVSQYIFEMIALSVPSKLEHPGIEDGTLDSEILDKLEDLRPEYNFEEEKEDDPRWDDLKNLLT
ncbi:MAG: DUF177 domain-containing protein [Ichthyobacteriaceae bacterium]|nr:DUF177 domain-containing protein [Ichthyobacteriaceae bacterium]